MAVPPFTVQCTSAVALAGALFCLTSLPGCGGEDGPSVASGRDVDNSQALFAGVVIHQPGGNQLTYSALVSGVDDTTDASLQAGYETPARVFPSAYDGQLYVPAGSSPTITKYTVDDGDQLIEGATVSFAGMGITQVLDAPQMGSDRVAPDKAYFFDEQSLQVVIWDPSAMVLTGGVIDVAPILVGAFPEQPGHSPRAFLQRGSARQRGNRLYIPVRWNNFDLDPAFVPSAGLLVIDTQTDEVVDLLVDDRVWDSIYTVQTDTGDLYLFTGALGVAHHWIRGSGRSGGAIRIRNGEDGFDPDYYLDLNEILGGRAVTSPVWAGGTSVYVKAYDEEHEAISDESLANPNQMSRQEAWRYWQVDLEGVEQPREVTEIPWGQTGLYKYEIHPYDQERRRLFLGMPASDFSRTTLYEAGPDGRFEERIDITGELLVLLPFRAP